MYYIVSLILLIVAVIGLISSLKYPKKVAEKNNKFADLLKKTGFIESKRIEFWDNVLFVDDISKQWCVKSPKDTTTRIYNFSDLVSYKFCEERDDVISGNTLNVLLSGKASDEIGAIAASAGSRKIQHKLKTFKLIITTNELQNPRIVINFTSGRIPRNYYNRHVDQVANNMSDTLSYIRRNS